MGQTTTTRLIDLLLVRSSVDSVLLDSHPRATSASTAGSSLENIIAKLAICGCPMKSSPTTAPIAAFAASVAERTSSTVTSAACVSIALCTLRTIAKLASTGAIAPCVKNTCSARVVHRMKCRVDTRFTGSAFGNWRRMIADAPFAKRQPKLGSACYQRGVLWRLESKCNLFQRNYHVW